GNSAVAWEAGARLADRTSVWGKRSWWGTNLPVAWEADALAGKRSVLCSGSSGGNSAVTWEAGVELADWASVLGRRSWGRNSPVAWEPDALAGKTSVLCSRVSGSPSLVAGDGGAEGASASGLKSFVTWSSAG